MNRSDENNAIALLGTMTTLNYAPDSANLDILDEYIDRAKEDPDVIGYDPEIFALAMVLHSPYSDVEYWDNDGDMEDLYCRRREQQLKRMGR